MCKRASLDQPLDGNGKVHKQGACKVLLVSCYPKAVDEGDEVHPPHLVSQLEETEV